MAITPAAIQKFRRAVYAYYKENRRELPWRKTNDPYKILVSEIMLQQTQVDRVVPKYNEFIKTFPDFKSLAKAKLPILLKKWQGLGYNRRALSLQKSAQIIMENFNGELPHDEGNLKSLPGVGPATAASIRAFAFNKPSIFIETNVRSVFIHHFFKKRKVTDKEIAILVEKTVDTENPRKWYNALMDYGTMLKQTNPNPGRKSTRYTKQSRFQGSNRQLRGAILRILLQQSLTPRQLSKKINQDEERIKTVLNQLKKEGFLVVKAGKLFIK